MPTSTLDRLARRRATWVGLIAVSLAIRLAVVFVAPQRLMWSDGVFYESIGWSLASSGSFGPETLYPPAYPTLIGAVYQLTGRSLLALRVADAIASAGTVAAAGAGAAWLFNPATGLLAAAFTALHPVLVVLPISHYPENLLALLSVPAFVSFAWAVRNPSLGRWAFSGLVFALFMQCKPNATGFLPGLALGAAIELSRRRIRWPAYALAFLVALALGLLPWTLRNHRVHGDWYLVTTGGGAALWRGNNPIATGSTTWNPPPPRDLLDSIGTRHSQVAKDRYYFDVASRWIRENPGEAFRLYLVKLGNLWALWPNTQTATPYRNTVANLAMGVCSIVLYLGALLSLRKVWAARLGFLPLAVVTFSLMNALALIVLRHRMAFEVVLIWLAAWGYVTWLESRRGARSV